MTRLQLAPDLWLPADIATAVTLIAGKRGSGKTNTAKRVVEQLHGAHVPFGVLDPVDVWWGLKAGRDGSRDGGLPIYVFGGKHADYPLAPTGGSLMADLFVDYRISAVMALREWSGGERARFVRDFAHRLLDDGAEIDRLRAGLGFLMRSSREPSVRRFIARVLDPDAEEAGA